jgi:hypothetical protein
MDSEKYIIEHMAGYLLVLIHIGDIELRNLLKDASFYMLERLTTLLANELKVRTDRSRIAEKQRKGLPPALIESVEYISELPEGSIFDHTSHTLCFKNVFFR